MTAFSGDLADDLAELDTRPRFHFPDGLMGEQWVAPGQQPFRPETGDGRSDPP